MRQLQQQPCATTQPLQQRPAASVRQPVGVKPLPCTHQQQQHQRHHQQHHQQHHHVDDAAAAADSRGLPVRCSRRAALLAAASSAAAAAAGAPAAHAYLVDETAAQSVFALASRSVVSINDLSRDVLEGVGTGVVWDAFGHVVTNYHCVSQYVLDKSGQQSVQVVLDDGSGNSSSSEASTSSSSSDASSSSSSSGKGRTYTARVIGTDAMHDLAVLQIDAPASLLVPIRMGTSADLKVGQSVYAIGNPSGLSKTLTSGVVSGLDRAIPAPTGTRINGVIQTDASINAGNSGGPLLDSFGRLVGLNTASFTRSGSGRGSGVNFALPADLLRSSVPNLIIYGTASGKGVRRG